MANFAVRRNEYLDQAVLYATITNQDGDLDTGWSPPAGFGDCLILDILLEAFPIATDALTTGSILACAVCATVLTGTETRAPVGVGDLRFTDATTPSKIAAAIHPENAVLFQEGDTLQFEMPELDSNAAPTVDIYVYVRVQRLRNTGGATASGG